MLGDKIKKKKLVKSKKRQREKRVRNPEAIGTEVIRRKRREG